MTNEDAMAVPAVHERSGLVRGGKHAGHRGYMRFRVCSYMVMLVDNARKLSLG